jgi:hypothetical protein
MDGRKRKRVARAAHGSRTAPVPLTLTLALPA